MLKTATSFFTQRVSTSSNKKLSTTGSRTQTTFEMLLGHPFVCYIHHLLVHVAYGLQMLLLAA
jgi:hypothetical protein